MWAFFSREAFPGKYTGSVLSQPYVIPIAHGVDILYSAPRGHIGIELSPDSGNAPVGQNGYQPRCEATARSALSKTTTFLSRAASVRTAFNLSSFTVSGHATLTVPFFFTAATYRPSSQ